MDQQDVDVEQLNDDVLKAFLAEQVDEHGRLSSAGVMPLLEYLRDEGVVTPEPVRGFARYTGGIDPRTEIPPTGLIPLRRHRRPPFIYTDAEILALTAQPGQASARLYALRPTRR